MNTIGATQRSERQHPHHVLLVEDEPTLASGLAMVMRDEGYEVDTCETGGDALKKFGANGFDLLVADLRLPDIDGMEVIGQARNKKPGVKVVIMTGYPSVSSAVQAVKMGVSDYLRKPFTVDEFVAAVRAALKEGEKETIEELITETQKQRLIQREEVIRVLNKASEDELFWRELLENGSGALEGYRLSPEAKAAIASGDLGWLQKNIGELTEEQLILIHGRLEREAW